MPACKGTAVAAAVLGLWGVLVAAPLRAQTSQAPALLALDEQVLRDYAGVYRWEPDGYVYLQVWSGLTGANQLVAFDESGEVRTLYPTEHDRFFAGPGAAVQTAIESRIEFQRDRNGTLSAFTWRREGGATRTARKADIETREDVKFPSGTSQLAGTLIRPRNGRKVPAIILVPASGPQDRDAALPLAHFLVRRGIAVFGYDKRGVGGSTGDWNAESFDDLAGDAVAAFEYLKTRRDIDRTQVGLLGTRQAGWVMPLTAIRAKELAFVINVSGVDPAPALGQLQTPTLALFGELDKETQVEKNRAAWDAALKAGGNRDYTLRIVPKATHLPVEAPDYFTMVQEWLGAHVRGLGAAK